MYRRKNGVYEGIHEEYIRPVAETEYHQQRFLAGHSLNIRACGSLSLSLSLYIYTHNIAMIHYVYAWRYYDGSELCTTGFSHYPALRTCTPIMQKRVRDVMETAFEFMVNTNKAQRGHTLRSVATKSSLTLRLHVISMMNDLGSIIAMKAKLHSAVSVEMLPSSPNLKYTRIHECISQIFPDYQKMP